MSTVTILLGIISQGSGVPGHPRISQDVPTCPTYIMYVRLPVDNVCHAFPSHDQGQELAYLRSKICKSHVMKVNSFQIGKHPDRGGQGIEGHGPTPQH